MTYFANAHSYSLPRFIDTDALHQTLERLCLLTFIILGNSREVLLNARRVAKATKELIKAEQHNHRTLLKFEMLLSPVWRARVLKDLGGVKALKRWERSHDRAVKRRAGIKLIKPHASPAQRKARALNLAKAKAALHEKRSKQPHRFYNENHPNIYKDPCKVDFEGQFRLAPIKRGPRIVKTNVKVQPRRLSSGIWDRKAVKTRITSIKINKLNPIPLWPIEFEAAGAFEAQPSSVIPCSTRDLTPNTSPIVRSPIVVGEDKNIVVRDRKIEIQESIKLSNDEDPP